MTKARLPVQVKVDTTKPGCSREILLASPRGFCAGVVRAVEIVERALEIYGAPIYVKHAIVHNRHVVRRLENLGAVFVEDLDQVPRGANTIFSAHGVSPAVRDQAERLGLIIVDATCPLVTKVHAEARRYAGLRATILLVGHRSHVEVQGTFGEAPERTLIIEDVADAENVRVADPANVALITQTTLSLDDTAEIVAVLKRRFPDLRQPGKEDICFATQNRQNAVKALAKVADVVLVVGAAESSNSKRLVEVARAVGTPAHLIESVRQLDPAWLEDATTIGVTAGASAPEDIVGELVAALAQRYAASVREIEVASEDVVFSLPPQLQPPESTA